MRKKFKGCIILMLILVMVFTVVGCGEKSESNKTEHNNTEGSAETATQDTLTVAIGGDVGDMSPFATSAMATYVLYQIYEPLFDLGYNMEVTPVLAESWEQVDANHYTLKIRQGITDSAGNPFDANDVIFVLNTYTTDAENSAYVANVDLEKTVATDDYTVDLYLIQTNAYTFTNLSSVRMFTQEAWEASADAMVTTPIGTGAYELKNSVSGSYVELEARENYWGGTPEIQKLKLTVITEPSQATTALENGEVDLVMGLQASDEKYISEKGGFKTLIDPAISSMSIFFNMTESSIFSTKELRQALCYALDNEAINTVAYDGYAMASVCPYSTRMKDYVADVDHEMYTTTDLEKAKSLVQDAGIAGGTIRIATDGSTQQTAIAEIVQSTLKDLGITSEINNYDAATIWDVASDPTQWDIIINQTAAPSGYGLDQLNAFLVFLNWSKWSGPEFDEYQKLYAEAIGSETSEECQAKTVEAVKLIEEVCPTFSVVQLSNIYAYKENLNFRVWNQSVLMVKDLKFE